MSHCHPRWPSPDLPGDPPFWDERGDESQLLVQRCGQPHGFHPYQNQRPQRGPVHHPPCRGGSHIRCASKSLSMGLFWYCGFFSCTLNVFLCFLAAPGIYSSTEMLDFGTLRSQGKDMLQFFLEQSVSGLLCSPSLCSFFRIVLQIVLNCSIYTF